ncbi:hypothetical protein GUITHDRAFT_118050 [Guillardia theta CCMP2712]|uniref:HotDog ACOT-type domain-containing protein n=1 Tax=Guillardia theta (strain CCMP2712) TaxID=905079 RepID=L1IHR4_GUITC|nr:hypothetical protein GUITHDRAFT_118050 [Guillardia theta CCMP2712]EKX35773.1 hypothetical protein GUITHDRAFT_118050 [Guillardia theta CCMP2712]|eukprot:XP_005822753.1 hypothetical protein GUITHDRAFT_118050 [Guillardia theta CCMP2712]
MSEVIGQATLGGRHIRMGAGEILKVMDLCAASAAMKHVQHQRTPTLAFDRLELLVPICHGDLVLTRSLLVHSLISSAGAHGCQSDQRWTSAMGVQVVGRKKDMRTRHWYYTHEAFATFVSLGPDGKPSTVPELVLETQEEIKSQEYAKKRVELARRYAREQAAFDSHPIDPLELEFKKVKGIEYMHIEDTVVRLRKNFLPRSLNGLGTIFGGDLMEWMEGAAIVCARNFTRNSNVVTIAMDNLFFMKPILPTHMLELTARVETTVKIIESMWNQKKQDDVSHKGYFTILNTGEYGDKEEIFVKLEVGEDELSQREYLKAKHRAEFLWPESCRSRPSYGQAFTQEGVVPYPPWGDEERSYFGIA